MNQQSVEMMVQSYGLKMTPQRRAIVEYLESAHHHPTAEDVMGAVNRLFPMTSRATVYNTLNWLREAGLVAEVHEGGQVRFDPNTSHHHHFICRRCNQVRDIEENTLGTIQVHRHLPGGLLVEDFEVTLRGLCDLCQK
ncbi:MAG: Fur family transcriptional regulator [Blastocatellia bacterium]|nr:Fur family transcriptional regulator [Blastocatellia bacterium]